MTNNKRLLVHIGGARVGSTAIQKWLLRETEHLMSLSVLPILITESSVLEGREAAKFASRDAYMSLGGTGWGGIQLLSGSELLSRHFIEVVNKSRFDTVIWSWEGLASANNIEKLAATMRQIDRDIEIVLAVRPPIEWAVSAWAQFGVFSGQDIDAWISNLLDDNAGCDCPYFGSLAEKWSQSDWVSKMHIISLTESMSDVNLSLASVLGADYSKSQHGNFRMHQELINLLMACSASFDAKLPFVLEEFAPAALGNAHRAQAAQLSPNVIDRLQGICEFESEKFRSLLPMPEFDLLQLAWLKGPAFGATSEGLAPQVQEQFLLDVLMESLITIQERLLVMESELRDFKAEIPVLGADY